MPIYYWEGPFCGCAFLLHLTHICIALLCAQTTSHYITKSALSLQGFLHSAVGLKEKIFKRLNIYTVLHAKGNPFVLWPGRPS